MYTYVVPYANDVRNRLDRMRGRIILDNSFVTLRIGILNGKLIECSRDFIEFSLELMAGGGEYKPLMDNQQEYMQGLCELAEEKKLFTVDGIVRKEMLDLKRKSDKCAGSFIEPDFIAYFRDFSNGVDELLRALNKNVPYLTEDSMFRKISHDINGIMIRGKKQPSRIDRRVVATALYESHAKGEEINILANDPHIYNLLEKFWESKNRRRLDAKVRCFTFDKERGYELVQAYSTLRK